MIPNPTGQETRATFQPSRSKLRGIGPTANELLSVEALWKPTLIPFAIAFTFPLLGFFLSWSSLARKNIFKGDFISPDKASVVVVRAVWFAVIIYCLATIGLLTAFKKLELTEDVWSQVSVGVGFVLPIATFIKQLFRERR